MTAPNKHIEKLKYIFDNTKVGIAICNAHDNHLEMVNPAFAHIHGYEPHELIGVAPGEVFAPECMLKLEADEQDSICSSNDISFETVHYKKDGSPVEVLVHITVIKDGNAEVIYRIANIQDISEKRKKEKKLEELQTTQTQFISLATMIPDLIWMKDMDGKYLDCNVAFERFFGTSKENILGKTDYDFFDKEAADVCRKTDIKALETGDVNITQESFIYLKEQISGILEVRKVPAFNSQNEVIGVLGIGRDITRQKQQEALLIKQEQEFRTLAENIPDPIFRYNTDGIRIYVNAAVEKISGIPAHELLGKMPTDSKLVSSKDSKIVANSIRKVIQTGKVDTIEAFHRSYGGEGIYFHNTNIPEFGPNGSVESVLSITRDVTAQKKLAESVEFTEGIINSIPDMLFELNKDGIYLNIWSHNQEHLLGTKELLLGKNIRDFLSPEACEVGFSAMQEAEKTGSSLGKVYCIDLPDGEQWFELSLSKMKSGNFLVLARDITERKEMETKLYKSEVSHRLNAKMLQAILESSPNVAIFALDTQYRYIAFNKEHVAVMKAIWNLEITIGICMLNHITIEDDNQKAKALFDKALGGECFIDETEYGDDALSRKFWQTYYSPIINDNGEVIGLTCFNLDITEKKEAEIALMVKEREFRTLAENSLHVIVRYDHDLKRTYANPAWAKVNGIDVSEVLGKKPREKSVRVAPIVMEYELKLNEVIQTGKNAEIEISWQDEDGNAVWYMMSLVVEYDANENIIGVLSISHDITERKRMEKNLSTTLSKFEQFINNIPEMAWIKDSENRFIMANQVVADVLNVSSVKDVIGKTLYDFFPAKQAKKCLESDTAVMQQGVALRTEDIYFSPDGKKIWVETIKTPFKDESGKIIGTIGTARDIKERIIVQKKIDHMAHHDALTGLPNRILVKNKAEQMLESAKKNNTKIALLFVDLDEFKTINDTMGHAMGDTILKVVASRLQNLIRKEDVVSRQGGDEFVILLSDIKEIEEVVLLVERILYKFEESYQVEENYLYTSASIGIAVYPEHGNSFESLLQNADSAMYKAKELGKNTYSFFTEQIKHHLIGKFKIQNDLKSALINNEFELHYQPQIDLITNSIVGAEALIRWKHPQLGMIPPMNFIPIAESNGLIVKIGEWVIKEACRQAAVWNREGISLVVAVNISAVQFRRGNLQNVINEALLLSGLEPKFLELELTESLLMNDVENILKTVKEFKKIGVQLSIDDFGTGYSSLAYLKRFAVDKLKIDKSFVQDIVHDNEDATIVKTIIQMAKNLNLKTIAEGVEDGDVLTILESYGCDEIQGYHFSKPLEVKTFEIFYKQYAKEVI